MNTIPTSIRIPKELYEWLKNKAEEEHRTISNTIISILADEMESNKEKTNK